MLCEMCPPARSQVIVDFAAGHAVCRACGVVLRDIVYEEAGGDEVKTRTLMDRLQPSSATTSSTSSSTVFVRNAYQKSTPSTSMKRTTSSKRITYMRSAQRDLGATTSKWHGPAIEHVHDTCDRSRVGSRTNVRASNLMEHYLGCATLTKRAVTKRNVEVFAVVCVYIACREHKCARTVSEVCYVMNVKENDFKKIYKIMIKTLRLRVRSPSPIEFLGRFSQLLQWNRHSVEVAAHQLIQTTPPDGSIAPAAVAVAALYLAASNNSSAGEGNNSESSSSSKISAKKKKRKEPCSKPTGLFNRKRSRLAAEKEKAAAATNVNEIGSLLETAKALKVSLTSVKKAYTYLCTFQNQWRSNTPPASTSLLLSLSSRTPSPTTV